MQKAKPSKSQPPPGPRWWKRFREDGEVRAMALTTSVWLVSVLLVVAAGVWLHRIQDRQSRHDAEGALKATAQFVADQVARWRRERLDDAALLMALADPSSSWIGNISQPTPPNQATFRILFQTWQQFLQAKNILLVDVRGRVRASLLPEPEALPPEIMDDFNRAMTQRQPLLTDLYWHGSYPQPSLTTISPLLDFNIAGSPAIGAILVQHDASESLYPMLQTWPTPSASGESLLIRSNATVALCLNELALQSNTALRLAFPLTATRQPAVQAALGRRGVWYGTDHLGEPTLSFLKEIPGSPWLLVTQQDLAEVRQSWQKRGLLIWIMLGTLIVTDTILLALSNQQRKRMKALAQLEENQRASSHYARSLLEASLDPLVTIRADGTITDVNEALVQATGVERNQLVGTDFSTYFTDLEKARAVYQQVFAEGVVRDYPLAIRHVSGRVIEVLYNASVYRDIEGQVAGVFAAARDVTKQKEAENLIRQINVELENRVRQRTAELEAVNQELARSNSDLDQFAYVASHDLQEPLRGVRGCVDLLLTRTKGLLDERSQEIARHAADGATRMHGLIEDLLAYSRVGTRGAALVPTDSGQALREALLNLETAVHDSWAVVVGNSLPTLPADPAQLRQLFQNLIGNAIKFRGPRPPRIEIKARPVGTDWEFSVNDNGIGIEPAYFERIFIIFQRLHSRSEYPGTGIGLAICKKIVERHGGRIWVESVPGQGTTFFFTLPGEQGARTTS